ncbi:MAG: MobF family relaxase [Thermoleophilia bacterium]
MITVERVDPLTGGPRLEERTLAPVAGFDLVFSAPKSVSLLHALGGDGVRYEVDRAHRMAWQAAVDYLEAEACVTRRGRGGAVRERAGGFVAAAHQHRTSRAGDPQLHTHVIVGNLARSPDGAWRALDGDAILRTHRLAAGYLYQAQLRHELTRALGVDWEDRPGDGRDPRGSGGSAAGVLATTRADRLLPRRARDVRVSSRTGRRDRDAIGRWRSTWRELARSGDRERQSTA